MNANSMKKMVVLCALFLFLISLCACGEQHSGHDDEMTEVEPSVTVWLLTEQVSYLSDEEHARFTYAYDSNGNLIEEHYYSRGEQLTHYEYSYDEHNNLIAKMEYCADGTITQFTFSHEFDEKGNIVTTTQYSNGAEDEITSFVYDNNNNLIEEATFANGSEISKTTYVYDTNNNQIEEHYFLCGQEIYRYTSEYDYNNYRTKRTCYNADGTEREQYVYQYDLEGNMKSRAYYHGGILAYRTEYTLNKAGIPTGWKQGNSESGTYDYQVISCSLEQAYALQERYGTGRVVIR